MVVTPSGRHITIRAKRLCKKCGVERWHHGVHYRLRATSEPRVPPAYEKEITWVCEACDELTVETKEVIQPSDKTKIISRFLSINEDYDILGMTVSSRPDEVIFRVKLPSCDMSEIRAIQNKEAETGFITVAELMKLQKAGFRRANDIPSRPMPKGRRLRERARQKAFSGEARQIN